MRLMKRTVGDLAWVLASLRYGFTFTGSAGRRISLGGGWSAGWALASIINPDGTNLINPSWGSGGIYFDVRTLPLDGTYTILIDPENGNTGNITLTLYDVPPDPVATITPGGPSVTVTTTMAGQQLARRRHRWRRSRGEHGHPGILIALDARRAGPALWTRRQPGPEGPGLLP